MAGPEHLAAAKTEVLWQAHRHLRHAGIGLAVAGATAMKTAPKPDLRVLLEESDLFGAMDELDRQMLLQ